MAGDMPIKFVNELNKNLASQGAPEYLSGKVKERKHTREVGIDFFSSQKHQEAYRGLKGDSLKRAIINELKDSLEDVTTKEELQRKKSEFLKSPQMQILDTPQGKSRKYSV